MQLNIHSRPHMADCENLNVCTPLKMSFPVELKDHETLLWLMTKKDLLFQKDAYGENMAQAVTLRQEVPIDGIRNRFVGG